MFSELFVPFAQLTCANLIWLYVKVFFTIMVLVPFITLVVLKTVGFYMRIKKN